LQPYLRVDVEGYAGELEMELYVVEGMLAASSPRTRAR